MSSNNNNDDFYNSDQDDYPVHEYDDESSDANSLDNRPLMEARDEYYDSELEDGEIREEVDQNIMRNLNNLYNEDYSVDPEQFRQNLGNYLRNNRNNDNLIRTFEAFNEELNEDETIDPQTSGYMMNQLDMLRQDRQEDEEPLLDYGMDQLVPPLPLQRQSNVPMAPERFEFSGTRNRREQQRRPRQSLQPRQPREPRPNPPFMEPSRGQRLRRQRRSDRLNHRMGPEEFRNELPGFFMVEEEEKNFEIHQMPRLQPIPNTGDYLKKLMSNKKYLIVENLGNDKYVVVDPDAKRKTTITYNEGFIPEFMPYEDDKMFNDVIEIFKKPLTIKDAQDIVNILNIRPKLMNKNKVLMHHYLLKNFGELTKNWSYSSYERISFLLTNEIFLDDSGEQYKYVNFSGIKEDLKMPFVRLCNMIPKTAGLYVDMIKKRAKEAQEHEIDILLINNVIRNISSNRQIQVINSIGIKKHFATIILQIIRDFNGNINKDVTKFIKNLIDNDLTSIYGDHILFLANNNELAIEILNNVNAKKIEITNKNELIYLFGDRKLNVLLKFLEKGGNIPNFIGNKNIYLMKRIFRMPSINKYVADKLLTQEKLINVFKGNELFVGPINSFRYSPDLEEVFEYYAKKYIEMNINLTKEERFKVLVNECTELINANDIVTEHDIEKLDLLYGIFDLEYSYSPEIYEKMTMLDIVVHEMFSATASNKQFNASFYNDLIIYFYNFVTFQDPDTRKILNDIGDKFLIDYIRKRDGQAASIGMACDSDKLKLIHNDWKKYRTQLIKNCKELKTTDVYETKICRPNLYKDIRGYLNIPVNNSYDRNFNINIDLADPLNSCSAALNNVIYKDFVDFFPNRFAYGPLVILWENGIKQRGVDAGGGTKVFLDAVGRQIMELGLFKKQMNNSSYIINENFDNYGKIHFHHLAKLYEHLHPEFIASLGKKYPDINWDDFKNIQDYMIYNFVSNLILKSMVSNMPIGLNLSIGLLIYMINPDPSMMTHIAINVEENGSVFGLLTMLKGSKEKLKADLKQMEDLDMGMNFNEFSDDNTKVTDENFIEYLYQTALSESGIKNSAKFYGFIDTLKAFEFKNYFDVRELQLLIKGTDVKDFDVEKLIEKITIKMPQNQEEREIGRLFKLLLRDKEGKKIPLKPEQKEEDRLLIRKRFLSDLILFWTGLRSIPTSELNVEYTNKSIYPESHTCFNTIELPIRVKSVEELYTSIIDGMVNAGKGLQQLGGMGQRQQQSLETGLVAVAGTLLGSLLYFNN